jgi:ABC-type lipoprotein release transport system permease subunit
MKNLFWMRLAFLFLERSWRSAIALSIMIAFAVGALVFLSSLATGTNDTMVRNSVGLFSGHVAGKKLPPGTTPQRLAVRGVKGALVRGSVHVVFTHKGRVEPLDLIGVDPPGEIRLTSLPRKIREGHYPRAKEKGVLLSETVAKKLGARVGGTVRYETVFGKSLGQFTVTGIYRTGVAYLDQGIAITPKFFLPPEHPILSGAVFVKDGVDPGRVVRAYAASFKRGVFVPWTEFMPDLRQLIDLNSVSMIIVMLLVFAIVALSISCAFIIFILKSMREHGIMKSMGVTPGESARLITSQIFLVTLASSLAGTALGALACILFGGTGIDLTALTSHNQYFAVSGVIYPRLTIFSLCLPPALALAFGTASALWPSVFVARTKAADILRSAV